jgi:transcriptional regulator with XRE-family HTH domain
MDHSKKTLATVADRIRYLIEDYAQGTVNQAAVGMGIPQATLVGIVGTRGKPPLVKHPKAEVLRRIAEYYEIPLDWLVRGEGATPESEGEFAEGFRWRSTVRQLGLGPRASLVLWNLPNSTAEVAENLKSALSPRENKAQGERWTWTPELQTVYRLEMAVWVRLFRELIRRFGPELIRDFVEANLEHFVRGKTQDDKPRRRKKL